MRAAYADPPYIGKAKKHYGHEEVDHAQLINLLDEQYDAWALSCNGSTLKQVLDLCPEGTRAGMWVKPFCIWKQNVNPAYCYEAVIWKTARRRTKQQQTVRDFISCNITLRKGLVGAKPPEVCDWILDLMNVQKGDTLDDLFPGTAIMGSTFLKKLEVSRDTAYCFWVPLHAGSLRLSVQQVGHLS